MAVQLISNTLLQTALPSPYLHTPLVPFTIFDKAASNMHVRIVCGFKPPMPSSQLLKSALSEVLTYFPHLAGRFTSNEQGQPCIALNNVGIRVIETYLPTPLSDYLPFDPSAELSHLLPGVEGVEELFLVQLNRYKCGGLVIGFAVHHHVVDGHSFSSFLCAWTKVVRDLDIETLPYHDRENVFLSRNPPKVEFDHRSVEFGQRNVQENPNLTRPIKKIIIHFSTAFINNIKEKVVAEDISSPKQKYTSLECLVGHLWKQITHARGLQHEEITQLLVAVNGRARMKPQVPVDYFGNVVLHAYPRLTVREVVQENHAYVTKAIHDAVAAIDNKYFQSFVDFGELSRRNNEKLEPSMLKLGNPWFPNLEVDSWLRFKFHDLDFGGGPCAFCVPDIPVEGALVLWPSCREGGGVEVVISLFTHHAHLFQQICYSLEYPSKI